MAFEMGLVVFYIYLHFAIKTMCCTQLVIFFGICMIENRSLHILLRAQKLAAIETSKSIKSL